MPTSITDLPPELLLKIFDFLPPSDRRLCRHICRKFATAAEFFKSDYTLYLRHCLLACAEPAITLRASSAPFAKLRLGGDLEILPNLCNSLWAKIGERIEELVLEADFYLEYSDAPTKISGLLVHLKRLTTLHLRSGFEAFDGDDFKRNFGDEALAEVFGGIRRVVLDGVWFNRAGQFDDFVGAMPRLEAIEVICSGNMEECEFGYALHFVRNHAPLVKSLEGEICKNVAECEPPIEGLELQRARLRMTSPKEALAAFLHSQRSIQEVGIQSRVVAGLKFDHLTSLRVGCVGRSTVEGLKTIESLDELQDLTIDCLIGREQTCYFGHNVLLNKKVRKLSFNSIKAQTCRLCFKAMLESFPSVDFFDSECGEFSADQVTDIILRLKELRTLQLKNETTVSLNTLVNDLGQATMLSRFLIKCSISDRALQKWPFMPELRTVSFFFYWDLNTTARLGLLNFVKNTPALEHLSIEPGSELSDIIINILSSDLKRLRTLNVHNCSNISVNAWQKFIKSTKTLERLHFTRIDNQMARRLEQFFDIPSLRELECGDEVITRSRLNDNTLISRIQRTLRNLNDFSDDEEETTNTSHVRQKKLKRLYEMESDGEAGDQQQDPQEGDFPLPMIDFFQHINLNDVSDADSDPGSDPGSNSDTDTEYYEYCDVDKAKEDSEEEQMEVEEEMECSDIDEENLSSDADVEKYLGVE